MTRYRTTTEERSMRERTITRAELVRIVERCIPEDCGVSTRDGLRRVAATTDAVAVGWFHCDGVKCPMAQVRARPGNRAFQTAFDEAMAERFGILVDDVYLSDGSFVVRVDVSGGAS